MNINDKSLEMPEKFGTLDYFILFTTFLTSLGIGIYFVLFDKHLTTAKDYLFGGHKMKVIPIAVSLLARCAFYNLKILQ